MKSLRPSICFAAVDLDYIIKNGGIGTYFWLAAHTLARAGWRVHVLYCNGLSDEGEKAATSSVRERLAEAGICFSTVEEYRLPRRMEARDCFGTWNLFRSQRILYALQELDREHHFDLIEFAEWGAAGFRVLQARNAGLALTDARIIVKLHSSSQWCREGNHCWLGSHDDARQDYFERSSFENAQIQASPCRYMLDYARSVGWNVRNDARVTPNPFPAPQTAPRNRSLNNTPEVVFFGRLETRKGLEVFVNAARKLDARIPLTFLGKDMEIGNGRRASDLIRSELFGHDVTIHTDFNREMALQYLTQSNRVAVIASLRDNYPYTVLECAVNGIPFLASSVGGIPEILPDPHVQARCLFQPNAKDLYRSLQAYLDTDAGRRRELGDMVLHLTDHAANHRQVVDFYDRCVGGGSGPILGHDEGSPIKLMSESAEPLVTVVVPFYNLGAYLPETLASIAAQTYRNLEVLVIDDGSTDPMSRRIFEEQSRIYPDFRFLSQENGGLCVTRNRGLREARGEFYLPVDADNIVKPCMVETFVKAMRRNPQVSALSCYHLAFRKSSDLVAGNHPYSYCPTGGPSHCRLLPQHLRGRERAISHGTPPRRRGLRG